MYAKDLRSTLNDIKASTDLVEFSRTHYGLRPRHSGDAIRTPHQIRPGDSHPSFAIWHTGCKDFTTGTYYDLFSFIQAMEGCSFKEAVQMFRPDLFTPKSEHFKPEVIDKINENRQALRTNIQKWHDALLANPECTDPITGQSIKVLEYVTITRGINQDTIDDLMLGYDAKTKRLIIPFIRNGQPVYYAGRDLTSRWKTEGDIEQGKKYKYAPIDYGVEKIIWGLDTLKNPNPVHSKKNLLADIEGSIADQYLRDDVLFICEGLLDAAILYQDGWQVLCTGGGSFSQADMPLVLDIMAGYKKVVFSFDNDNAGKGFARRFMRLCMGQKIKFANASIPETLNDKPVKDINDYYLAGGSLNELAQNAVDGIMHLAQELENIDDVYNFVQQVKPFASKHDLSKLYDLLADKKIPSTNDDPNAPVFEGAHVFKKSQLKEAFRAGTSESTDLQIIERVLRDHNIVYASDNKFYEYTGRAWEKVTKYTIIRYVADALGPTAKAGRARALMDFMKSQAESLVPFDSQPIFSFRNGIFLLDDAARGVAPDKCFVPHSPDFMNTAYVEYSINPYHRWGGRYAEGTPEYAKPIVPEDKEVARIWEEGTSGAVMAAQELALREKREAEHPLHKMFKGQAGYNDNETASHTERASQWRQFCQSVFVDRDGKYDPLLEREAMKMAGYVFFPDNRFQVCFMLVGKGSNGKSTFLEVMKELFGRHNCSYLRPDRLANSFDVMAIRHSMLNICHESAKTMNGAEETLKAVTSGDPVTGSYKGQDAESFQSRAKWMIATNSIMDIKDVSYGFLRRMVVIPFNAKFTGPKVDYVMVDKLKKELPEIFWWAFEGFIMLMKGERFTKTADQLAWDEKLRETIDPTYLFTRESLTDTIRAASEPVSEADVFKSYMDWCKATFNEITPRYQTIDKISDAVDARLPGVKVVDLIRRGRAMSERYFVDTTRPYSEVMLDKFDVSSIEKLRELGAVKGSDAMIDIPPSDVVKNVNGIPAEVPADCGDDGADKAPAGEREEDMTLTLPEPEEQAQPDEEAHTPSIREKNADIQSLYSVFMDGKASSEAPYWKGCAIAGYVNGQAAQGTKWYLTLTPEEFTQAADACKRAISEDDATEWAKDALQALRDGWVKRTNENKITPNDNGAGQQ